MTLLAEAPERIAATIAGLAESLRAADADVLAPPDFTALDSMKLVELVLKLEDHFNIRLTAEDIDDITSFDALAVIVARHQKARLPPAPPPAPQPVSIRLSIARAEMRGGATRLSGAIAGPAGGVAGAAIIGPAGNAILPFTQAHFATGRFDALCDLDLARATLSQCRLSIPRPGLPALEAALSYAGCIIFPDLADNAPNRLHLNAALADDITRPNPPELLRHFESLGDNCEFGVFAAMLGNTRPSLFRTGGTSEWMTLPRPNRLPFAAALAGGFAGFAEPEDLRLEYIFGEWMVFSNRYDFCFHTGQKTQVVDLPALAARQSKMLLAGKQALLEDLRDPQKIFIRKSNGRDTVADIAELHTAMRRHGTAWLLWLAPATGTEPPGTVTLLPGKLLRVTISKLAPYTRADRVCALSWLTALTAAHLVLATPSGLSQT
jgi:acyl carrier protein